MKVVAVAIVAMSACGCGTYTPQKTLGSKTMPEHCDPGPCPKQDTRCFEVCLGGRNLYIGDSFCEVRELFIRGATCGHCSVDEERGVRVMQPVADRGVCYDGPCRLDK